MDAFSLKDKIVLITGGGTGLGFAIARSVIAAGGRAVITGRREEVLCDSAALLGERAVYFVNDISQLDSIPAFVQRVEAEVGPIHGLVNNAGVSFNKEVTSTTDSEFQQVLDIHLRGSFALTRECARFMIPRESGSIIFMCSMASAIGLLNSSPYTAAKSAMKGLCRSLSMELSPHGIRVNDIAPGWISSAMTEQRFNSQPGRREMIAGRTPLRRIGEAADIGNAAVFLLSDASKFITATELCVDGGISNAGL